MVGAGPSGRSDRDRIRRRRIGWKRTRGDCVPVKRGDGLRRGSIAPPAAPSPAAEPVTRRRLAWACFGVASVGAVALIGVEARGTTFSGDEWAYLHRLAHQPLSSALFEAPGGKYLIAVPMLLYAALANAFGTDSYLPFRIVGLLLLVLASGLLLELTRRRIGYLAALPAPILLLGFGAAHGVVAIPARIPSQIAICAGLGMLLALDRRDRRGDLVACLLGAVAVVSHPVAVAFVVAAGVRVVFDGWRVSLARSWVALVPAGIFALWMVTLRQPVEGAPPATPSGVASFAGELFVAVSAALTGVFRSPWTSGVDFINGWSVAIAIALVALAVAAVIGARRISVGLAATSAALVVGLASPALTPWAMLRAPESPRYLYAAAILVVLVAAEVIALRRITAPPRAAVAAVAAVVFASALYSNLTLLRERASDYVEHSTLLKAELGALDLARPHVPPAAEPSSPAASEPDTLVRLTLAHGQPGEEFARRRAASAPVYYEIAERYGSPGFGASAIAALPSPMRAHVDRIVAEVADTKLRAIDREAPRSPSAGPPRARGSSGGCIQVRPGRPRSLRPTELLSVERRGRAPAAVRVGRFADQPAVALEWPAGADGAVLSLPLTRLGGADWEFDLSEGDAVRICTVPRASGPGR
jgi:hypothetical protein